MVTRPTTKADAMDALDRMDELMAKVDEAARRALAHFTTTEHHDDDR